MKEHEKKPCVYAIRSSLNGRVYIGQTVLLEKRVREHNAGRVRSTKGGEPWILMAMECLDTQSEARWLEISLKKSRSKRLAWLESNGV